MRGKRKPGITGYKGIYYRPKINAPNPYHAMLRFCYGQDHRVFTAHIGYYETAELAYIARIKFIDSLK